MARIALVHDIADVGGLQAKILRGAGHEVDHLHLSEFGAAWNWPAKALAIPLRLLAYLPIIWRLRFERYDVIHIHWVTQGIVGVLAAKPFFLQAHGSDLHVNLSIRGVSWLSRRIIERARLIFYVTPNLKAYLSGHESKIRYLPNPVDVEALRSAPPATGTVQSALVFVRLDSVKGPELIFPAVEHLANQIQFTGLAWGPLKAEYMTSYGKSVRFVDRAPHSMIGAFLAQFDVIIGQMRQGILSLSEIEAMAVGRPVITGVDWGLYQVDPPPVLAASGPDDIVAALRRLSEDGELFARLCREGPEWVRRNHGFDLHLRLLESAYFGRPSAEVDLRDETETEDSAG